MAVSLLVPCGMQADANKVYTHTIGIECVEILVDKFEMGTKTPTSNKDEATSTILMILSMIKKSVLVFLMLVLFSLMTTVQPEELYGPVMTVMILSLLLAIVHQE